MQISLAFHACRLVPFVSSAHDLFAICMYSTIFLLFPRTKARSNRATPYRQTQLQNK